MQRENITIRNSIESLSVPHDSRNVIDYYHYWNNEQIKKDLDDRRHNFSVLISNIFNDFNIGTVIRNCNAFLAKEIFVYGRKKFDRRGAVGSYIYENMRNIKSLDDLPKDCYLVGIDNISNAEPIETFQYPKDKHIIFCFGQEQVGLPDEVIPKCDKLLYIKQYGSVRSLNVGSASAVVLYDYVRKMT